MHRDGHSPSGSAIAAPALLDSVRDITAPWLVQVLRSAGCDISTIESIQVHPAGRSAAASVTLRYAGKPEGKPHRLICKFHMSSPRLHRAAIAKSMYLREVAAYREIHRHGACRLPQVYYAAADQSRLNLILEDLQTIGTPGDSEVDCTADEAVLVLGELASLHGCFARLSPAAAPDWLRDGAEETRAFYQTGLIAIHRRLSRSLIPEYLDLIDSFAAWLPGWYGYVRHAITLTHGDPRSSNALFRRDAARPISVLANWQLAGFRNPMHDVACLLVGSLSEAARREHERALLSQYCRFFEHNGPRYPLQEALDDYRYHLFSPLMFAVCTAAVLPSSARSAALVTRLLQRSCRALIDWGSMGLLRHRLAIASPASGRIG